MENELNFERNRLLRRIDKTLESPMIFLGFVWLVLLIVELIRGISRELEIISLIIWMIFIIDFVIKFLLAPVKMKFLKRNWLTTLSLVIPAFRVLRMVRFFRAVRAVRSFRLIRVLSSLNRSMGSLSAAMRKRGFGYVVLLTIGVCLGGAAGMYAFEKESADSFESYFSALWWTAMLIITIGSDYWPQSPEGRLLCLFLSVYGFAVFGYITATLASFFIGKDADKLKDESEMVKLRKEIAELSLLIRETNDSR